MRHVDAIVARRGGKPSLADVGYLGVYWSDPGEEQARQGTHHQTTTRETQRLEHRQGPTAEAQ